MAELKDSGERREFGTGAVRDISEGKGRCDLLPLGVVGDIIDDCILIDISSFKSDGKISWLEEVVRWFAKTKNVSVYNLILEVSHQFEDGAKKYGECNWQKGIPIHCYIDSAVRHYLRYKDGWEDEPHDRAFIWNIICCIWTMRNKPELDDFTKGGKSNEGNN